MFYSLDDIATFEEWDGDPLENAVIVDADTLFSDRSRAAMPGPGATPIYIAPEAWPGALPPEPGEWVDDADWDDEEADEYDWEEEQAEDEDWAPAGFSERLAGVAVELTAAVLLLFLLLALVLDRAETAPATPTAVAAGGAPLTESAAPPPAPDSTLVVVPYETYWVTQGLHGTDYGHLAVDLAAGKGSTIFSPINGVVRGSYVDQYGNTTLVIENDRYRVSLLHGDYVVVVGETLRAGQAVGSESNHGYTTDMQGNSCRNRECGYHTHLNIFDKQLGRNVDPLALLGLR